jgi:hypothetical protein
VHVPATPVAQGACIHMAPEPDCDGCLGSRSCWVCLGRGVVEDRRYAPPRPCRWCYGSGKCSMCQDILVDDVGAAPVLDLKPGPDPQQPA